MKSEPSSNGCTFLYLQVVSTGAHKLIDLSFIFVVDATTILNNPDRKPYIGRSENMEGPAEERDEEKLFKVCAVKLDSGTRMLMIEGGWIQMKLCDIG